MGIVGSVHFRLVPWSGLYFSRSIGPFLCSWYQRQGFHLLPVTSKAVPSVIAASVCWSLQCLVSALTQRGWWWTLFFLGSLVQSHCGEGGTLQTNNTGVRSQCLSHTGSAPAHGACSLPAHTARALGCSAGNNPRLAPPRSKPLRFRHSGSPQRRGLGWAYVL